MYQPKEVGKRLRRMRKAHGDSREKIAGSIGRTLRYYGDIERGTCGMSVETLIRLADYYHVSLDYLVYGDAEDMPDMEREQVKYAAAKLGHMEERKRNVVIEMLQLLEEQDAKRNQG